jgi:hypothetical protein
MSPILNVPAGITTISGPFEPSFSLSRKTVPGCIIIASMQFVLSRFYQNVGKVVYKGYKAG